MKRLFSLSLVAALLLLLASCNDGKTTSGKSQPVSQPSAVPLAAMQIVAGEQVADELFDKPAPSSGIFLSPNGGEHWKTGGTYTVRWSTTNSFGTHVKLYLYKTSAGCKAKGYGSCWYKTITGSTPNNGSYQWTIPTSIPTYSEYHVLISSNPYSESNRDWGDDWFTISLNGGGSADCYGDYVRKYPDLLAAYNASGGSQTIEAWGKSHYNAWGKGEGRTLHINCSGGGGGGGSAESCYGNYVRSYGDLLAAYNASGGVQSIEVWGKAHYLGYGQAEGRAACLPDADYNYLYKHNAVELSGHTIRWKSKTIQVSGASGNWRNAANRWPTVSFNHVGSPPSEGRGIEVVGYVNGLGSDTCALASMWWWTNGEMGSCRIKVNSNHGAMNCGPESDSMVHEVGHCIGVINHTSDGGAMDPASPNDTITTPVRNMISLLYSLSPGTDINSKRSSLARQSRKSSKYDPNGRQRIYREIKLMENGVTQIGDRN